MANVTVRNRNAGKFDKEGRKKLPNWEYRFDAATIAGKRQQISKSGFRTKAEATAAGTEAMYNYNTTGSINKPSEMSVSDYLDYWMEKYVRPNLTTNTVSGYNLSIKNHLKPTFGMYKLAALSYNPSVIQDWVTSMKIKGYSRNMITNVLATLSGALNYAVIPCKFIQSNPCQYVKVPAITRTKESKEHSEYIVNDEDFKKILCRFGPGTNFYIPIMLGYYLGTRIGESYGIDLLSDVDYENCTITINNQMQVYEKSDIRYVHPKYNSARIIKVTENIIDMLKKDKLEQQKNMFKYGEYYTKSYVDAAGRLVQLRADIDCTFKQIMPVSVKENGEILTPQSFKYCARVIHTELSIVNFHSHSLRHTHGTLLAEAGINPKTVMERLGHKDISTTLQTYTFNTDKMQDKCLDVIRKFAHN